MEHVVVDHPDVELVGEIGSFVLLAGRDRAAEHGLELERAAEAGRYCRRFCWLCVGAS